MELYTLDDQLRREEVFDNFRSLIWTERWQSSGDFELVTKATYGARAAYIPGRNVTVNVSNRVMQIDSCIDTVDNMGMKALKIAGSSIEAQMDDRMTVDAYPNGNGVANNWKTQGTPAEIVREVFRRIAHQNDTVPADNFPYMAFGNLYPPDNLPEPSELLELEVEPNTLLELVRDMCQVYDLGYRITRNGDASQLFFNVYSGNDRTTRQHVLPAVIFSADMDNLQNTSAAHSIAGEKNVAYVYSKTATQVVYWNPEDAALSGFKRKILKVDAQDINEEELTLAEIHEILRFRGLSELAKHRPIRAFDGEIPQTNSYIYDQDYSLGDLVEVRDPSMSNIMRVTEQIFVRDSSGFKSYPTLSMHDVVAVGDWNSFENNVDWTAAPGVWSDRPTL